MREKAKLLLIILFVFIPFSLFAQDNIKYKHIVLLDVTGSMLYKGDYPRYKSEGPSESELWNPAMNFIESLIDESEDQDEICIIPFRGDNDGKDGIPSILYSRKELVEKWEQEKKILKSYAEDESHYKDGTCIYKPLSRALNIINNTRDAYCFLYIITDGTENVGQKSDLYRVLNQFRKSHSRYAFYLALPTEKNESEIKQHLGEIEYIEGLKKFGVIIKPNISLDSADLENVLNGDSMSFGFSRKQHEYVVKFNQNEGSDYFLIDGSVISNGFLKTKLSILSSEKDISDIMDDIIKSSGKSHHCISATISSSDINIINNSINIEIILKESTKVRIDSISQKLAGKDLGVYYYCDSIWGLATPLELPFILVDTLKASFLNGIGSLCISVQSRDNIESSYSVVSNALTDSSHIMINKTDSVAGVALAFNRYYPYEEDDYGLRFWIDLLNPFNFDRDIRAHDLHFDINVSVEGVDNIINVEGQKMGKDLILPYQVRVVSQIHKTLFWIVRIIEWILLLLFLAWLPFFIKKWLSPRFPKYAHLSFESGLETNIGVWPCLYKNRPLSSAGNGTASNTLFTNTLHGFFIKEIVITSEVVNKCNPESYRFLSKQWFSQKWNGDTIFINGDFRDYPINSIRIAPRGTFKSYAYITIKEKDCSSRNGKLKFYKLLEIDNPCPDCVNIYNAVQIQGQLESN